MHGKRRANQPKGEMMKASNWRIRHAFVVASATLATTGALIAGAVAWPIAGAVASPARRPGLVIRPFCAPALLLLICMPVLKFLQRSGTPP